VGGDPLIGLDGLPVDLAVDPLEPWSLEGPFDSTDAYLAAHREEATDGCAPHGGQPSVGPKVLPKLGGGMSVKLFRRRTGDSCDPTEHCYIAVQISSGWWLGERMCAGRIDGGRSITTADTSLRWVSLQGGHAAAVEYTVTARNTTTSRPEEQIRWLRLCGVGSSRQPSCTRPVILSCTTAGGAQQVASFAVKEGRVSLRSTATPGEACDGSDAFVLGENSVTFP
jgi:hypothetical protein